MRYSHLPASLALAQRSFRLETLAASFLVDANDFLEACPSDQAWDMLRSLALTSPLLAAQSSHEEVDRFLMLAASTAQRMPKLQTMELWNGGKGHACLFRYQITEGYATISWRGTWKLGLRSRVISAWNLVAQGHTERDLHVEEDDIFGSRTIINCHGAAIYHLKLETQVAHPASVLQMRRLGDSYGNP